MTKTEILARLPDLPTMMARIEAIKQERERLYVECKELERSSYDLCEVTEVFEGQPIKHYGETHLQFHELGDDGEYRRAYMNPFYEDDEDPDAEVKGYLLELDGATRVRTNSSYWKKYTFLPAAVLAAKRFVAHGVVPLPDDFQRGG